ncbi:hypothetical protein C7445_101232 [Alicyclobacillus sacchari]|uniref:Uncharacterized protein n=1 Tax=Alicyclobacillus sacchari TaxID=392010 RepID=A0A4R8LVQ5_9BACL|nr:hypothetical protein C7445_101232 [Alicyclobacillus sacchari]
MAPSRKCLFQSYKKSEHLIDANTNAQPQSTMAAESAVDLLLQRRTLLH